MGKNYTLCKNLRSLVFSPAKKIKNKAVIVIFCCSVSIGNTFQNIPFAINCNNPVRFLFAQGVWQHRDLISSSSSLSGITWRNWPGVAVVEADGLLQELELVRIKYDEMTSTEDGHEDTQTAEEELVEGLAEGPPCAQTQNTRSRRLRSERAAWHLETRTYTD